MTLFKKNLICMFTFSASLLLGMEEIERIDLTSFPLISCVLETTYLPNTQGFNQIEDISQVASWSISNTSSILLESEQKKYIVLAIGQLLFSYKSDAKNALKVALPYDDWHIIDSTDRLEDSLDYVEKSIAWHSQIKQYRSIEFIFKCIYDLKNLFTFSKNDHFDL